MTYEDYNEVWESLDAGPCPAGHFCPSGTEDPKQCTNASVRSGSEENKDSWVVTLTCRAADLLALICLGSTCFQLNFHHSLYSWRGSRVALSVLQTARGGPFDT